MLHLISGTVLKEGTESYIANDLVGVQVQYRGDQEIGRFFLYPIFDEHAKTIKYYAFDDSSQKNSFSSLLKISGIGPKIAYEIAWMDGQQLAVAIQEFDVGFFQAIPGIGPKTAKKILVELKSSFSEKDLIKINADEALVKNIVKTLSQMGYEKNKIMTVLAQYEGAIVQDQLSTVLQWLIQHLQ